MLPDDDRGLALGVVIFFAILIAGVLLYTLFSEAINPILSMTESQAQTPGGAEQISLAQTIWNNVVYIPIFFAGIFIIARAARESGRR